MEHPLGKDPAFPPGIIARRPSRPDRAERPEPEYKPDPNKAFRARYGQVCKSCHQRVERGDYVMRAQSGRGVVHRLCPLSFGQWKNRQSKENTPLAD